MSVGAFVAITLVVVIPGAFTWGVLWERGREYREGTNRE